MDTPFDWSRRRDARRRIVAVSGVCAIALAVTLVLASCTSSTRGESAGATVHRSGRTVLREVRVDQAERLREIAALTTTTTRPAVNPQMGPPPPNTGEGKRVVYCNSCQTAWLIDETNYVIVKFPVSGHRGMPAPGTYHVFRKLEMGRSKHHPDLRLPYFTGFAWGSTTDIGFHGIPLEPDGSQIEADSQLGQPLSSGCVRVSQFMAKVVYDFAPVGTPVIVTE
ncbi:MAG: L,D-transpeptidase [Acidimicrobiia bacterium]